MILQLNNPLLFQVLEAVLVEASSMPAASYTEFVETCGTLEDIHLLLNYVATSSRTNAQVSFSSRFFRRSLFIHLFLNLMMLSFVLPHVNVSGSLSIIVKY